MAEAKAWVMIPISNNKGTEIIIDMRPLVQCKDCRHYDSDKRICFHPFGRVDGIMLGEWFCADGERKDSD